MTTTFEHLVKPIYIPDEFMNLKSTTLNFVAHYSSESLCSSFILLLFFSIDLQDVLALVSVAE